MFELSSMIIDLLPISTFYMFLLTNFRCIKPACLVGDLLKTLRQNC